MRASNGPSWLLSDHLRLWMGKTICLGIWCAYAKKQASASQSAKAAPPSGVALHVRAAMPVRRPDPR